ncbi:MAG: 23S rRNA (uracil(1939)-C(5))-methyltransferase RlmD [Saprospiraceae bacterium]|nr:23S rRNA (uracil(1939)-C(5))-methyltransferase RlmD [Saprospiraceae bacterium]
MPKIKKPKQVVLNIHSIGHKGHAIGKTEEGMVAFIRDAVPGDQVSALLNKKSKGVWQGRMIEIIKASEHRTNSFCSYFGICGGCSWQELNYEEQAKQKEMQVKEAVKRIGGLEPILFESILKAKETRWYRNKLEFTFSNHRWLTKEEMNFKEEEITTKALGFHRPESFQKVIDIEICHLQSDTSNRIKNWIRSKTSGREWSYYDIKSHGGLMRNMIIRSNLKGEVMVVIAVYDRADKKLHELFEELQKEFPEIVSCYVAENKNLNDAWSNLECHKIFGADYLEEYIDKICFKIGPKSFFQTNTKQSVALYQTVKEYADLHGSETVYDLYCGVGSIGLYLADSAKKIIGIEEIEAATGDARINADTNQISNAQFISGDVRKILNHELTDHYGHPDLIIVDPPRTGLHPDVCQTILEFQPTKIVYVSCNPATLARDLKLFSEKYQLMKLRPVDMFPHTSHVEAVALMHLKTV